MGGEELDDGEGWMTEGWRGLEDGRMERDVGGWDDGRMERG